MTVFQNLSPFFPPQASIVTVIRLVNDAVDTIESEGTMSHPLCVSPLTLLLSQSGYCRISSEKHVFSYILKLNALTVYCIFQKVALLGAEPRLALSMFTDD